MIFPQLTRREMLERSGMGFGMLGLAGLIAAEPANLPTRPLAPRPSHFRARAERVVHLFMNGGPSHVDTFDPKPLLNTYHGRPLPRPNLITERNTGGALRSPFAFRRYGKCGLPVSELFARTAAHIDDIAVIRSMHADVPNHEASLLLMTCGDNRQARPSMGAWITYGLGSENQNLPGFLVMCPGGYPGHGTQNWRSAFLPGAFQGTYLNTSTRSSAPVRPIDNIHNADIGLAAQRRQLDLVGQLNERHLEERQHDAHLEARLQSFELAYRMQTEAADVFDLSQEPAALRDRYGHNDQGRQLLLTRRLLERGVRVVQVWSGTGVPWDSHDNIEAHRGLARTWDPAIAAFLDDLKQRGLFETTLVLWGGEFGRTPVAEGAGRDHNHYGFTMWLAGGGVKGGQAYGATDEFGFEAVEKPVHVHDLHATVLHLLGLDHERLTFRYAGRDFRLTDVHGNVVREVIR